MRENQGSFLQRCIPLNILLEPVVEYNLPVEANTPCKEIEPTNEINDILADHYLELRGLFKTFLLI